MLGHQLIEIVDVEIGQIPLAKQGCRRPPRPIIAMKIVAPRQ